MYLVKITVTIAVQLQLRVEYNKQTTSWYLKQQLNGIGLVLLLTKTIFLLISYGDMQNVVTKYMKEIHVGRYLFNKLYINTYTKIGYFRKNKVNIIY